MTIAFKILVSFYRLHFEGKASWRNEGNRFVKCNMRKKLVLCEISGSHGGEYEVQSLLGYSAV
jgi:hypothetical protein